jgi:hypothetical protein
MVDRGLNDLPRARAREVTKNRAFVFVAAALFGSCTATDRAPDGRDAAADLSGAAGNAGSGGNAGSAGSAALVDAGAGAGGSGGGQAGAGVAGGGGQADAGVPWPPTIVTLERGGALGFCVSRGQVTWAEAVPDAAGGVVVSGTIHRGWENPPTCPSGQCAIADPLGPAPLSAEQQARLGALVAALPAGECAGPPGGGCDPCLISTVTVDGVSYVDNPCSAELCPGYFKSPSVRAPCLSSVAIA